MNIIFLGKDKEKFKHISSKLDLNNNKIDMFSKDLSDKNLKTIKDVEIIILFVDKKINRRIMRDLPELKLIVTMSTGYDHIDTGSANEFGISVCNVPSYGVNTVAEYTFGLILNLSRKIYYAINRVKRDNFSIDGLEGFDLKNKTIGVIGSGNIGKNVIRIAKGFDMDIIVFDKTRDTKLERDFGVKFRDLNELLKLSDIITIHIPLNENTNHLINKENIKNIKKGALIINTSRGEIIDTGALRWALDKKIISGAALDVLEGEEDIKEEIEMLEEKHKSSDWKTLIENHLLIDYDNVIITPHIAFYTSEAKKRILDTTIENITSFLNGRIKNKVK